MGGRKRNYSKKPWPINLHELPLMRWSGMQVILNLGMTNQYWALKHTASFWSGDAVQWQHDKQRSRTFQWKSWWEKWHKHNLLLCSKDNIGGPNGNNGCGWINWRQSNAPEVDDYYVFPSQGGTRPLESPKDFTSLSWSEVIELPLERHVAVLMIQWWWVCNGLKMMSCSSPWSDDSFLKY